ncbi:MAG: hypothetical protein V8S34_06385 [Lawsonibacter sp.]
MTDLEVYAPNQALDTSDEHVKYVYQYSELDGDKLTKAQEDGTYPIFEGDTLDVTNTTQPHTGPLLRQGVCEQRGVCVRQHARGPAPQYGPAREAVVQAGF